MFQRIYSNGFISLFKQFAFIPVLLIFAPGTVYGAFSPPVGTLERIFFIFFSPHILDFSLSIQVFVIRLDLISATLLELSLTH